MKFNKPVRVSQNVLSFTDGYWEWFTHKTEPDYEITGKYLFFSEDRKLLKEIAIKEIENNSFHHAKINMEGKNKGPEYVLCLYYKDDSRKNELAKKYKSSKVKYRYWKSDQDTIQGNYSEEFLSQLSPEERKQWTRDRTK